MNTPIKLLYQGNNLFFPLTCSEGVLVKDGESVALLTEVLLKKLELLIGGSGIVTQQTSDTSYVIGHTNKIDSLETSSPRLITYDSNGHITSSVPFNKMIISLNDGTELSSYDGSSEQTITLSSNFKTTDGKLDINWGYITNQGYITSSALDGYATQNWVNGKNYITLKSLSISDSTGVTQAYLDRELGVSNITYDNTTGLFKITKTWFLTGHQDLSSYATQTWVKNNYALSSSLTSHTSDSNIHVTSALKTAWTTASNWVSSVTATDSSDADTAINKWNEIIDFLANISDTSTLQGILAAKANSSDLDNYLPLSGGTITGNLTVNDTTTFNSQVYAHNGFATSSPVITDRKLKFLLNSQYNDLGVISVDVIDSSNHTYNFDGSLNVQGGLSIQGDFSIDGGFTGKSLTLLNPWNYIDSNTYKHAEIYLNDDSTPSLEFDNVSSVYFGNAYVLADTFNGKILGYIYGTLQRPLTITINGLSSEGTTKYTYNNSASKSLNIASGLNVSFATESGKLTISATDTTYSAGVGLALNDTTFNLLSASSSTIGGVKVSSVSSSAVTLSDSNKIYGVQSDSDGLAYVNVPWTDQKVKISSATSGSLYFTGNSSTSSTSGTTLSVFSYAFVTMEKGSTSKEGTMTFTLGNNKTSTTASNESGILKLYGANTGSTSLRSQAVTSDITVYLPTASGTLALTTDIPSLSDYVKSSDLATVAKTGSYTDLSNKPTIPTVPSTLPNPSSLSVNYNGTNLWTYNGSNPRTLNLKNGSNISITKDDSGNIVISNTYSYSLPVATTSTSGGIIVGNNLSISNGVLSAVNTTYNTATSTANGLMSSTDKAKLDGIDSGANKYSLPTASTDTLGGIKVGSYLAISSGVLSVSSSPLATTTIIGGIKLISDTKNTVTLTASTSTSKCYPVLLNSNNVAYVQVPWVDTDTNTTYSAGNYLSLSGTTFNHKTSGVGDAGTASGSAGTLSFGSSIKIPSISYDSYGHITGVSSTTVTLPSNPNTDTHYTSNLIVNSSSSSTSNTTSTISNGSVYLNLIENSLVRNSHKIVGSGATTVTSDASGNLTINSTNTVYTHPTQSSISVSNANGLVLSGITVNTLGHVTGVTTKTLAAADIPSLSYLPLAGGTMSGQIKKDGVSKSWISGREGAMIRMLSISEYSPFASIKTSNGSWEIGTYTSMADLLIFTYCTDSNYNAGTNSVSGLITFSGSTISGTLSGNASTATALTSSAGSSTLPVYFSNGKPVAINTTGVGISITGNANTASSASKLTTARTISLSGSVTGSASFDGSDNITISTSTNHSHLYAGSSTAGGAANSLVNFTVNKSTGVNANDVLYAAHTYYTSNGPSTSLGASTTDGALYSQAYSDSWVALIAQDYRNGRLFVRGKNNGTWQSWYRVALYNEIPSISISDTATGNAITGITYNNGTFTLSRGTFLTAITKAQVEAVLTGTITSHSHNYLSSLKIETSGSGNAITALSYGSGTITATLGTFALSSSLAKVATSGSYNDLSDLPTNHVTTNTVQTISGQKTLSTNLLFSASSVYNIGSESAMAHYVYAHRLLAVASICNSTTYSTNMITLPSKSGTMALTSDIPSLDGYAKTSDLSDYLKTADFIGAPITKVLTESDDENNLWASRTKLQIYIHKNTNRPANVPSGSYNSCLLSLPMRLSSDAFHIEASGNTQRIYTRANISDGYDGYSRWETLAWLSDLANYAKISGSSSQFIKADGSLDSNTYALSSALSNYLPLSGGTLTGALTMRSSNVINTGYRATTGIGGTTGSMIRYGGNVAITSGNYHGLFSMKMYNEGVVTMGGVTNDFLLRYFDATKIANTTNTPNWTTRWGVNGTLSHDGSDAGDYFIKVSNTNGAVSLLTSTNRGLYDNTVGIWLLYTDGTNTIIPRGNVGIGTSSPIYKLQVNGTTCFNGDSRYIVSGDGTLSIYGEDNPTANCGKETFCMQSCFDGADGKTHTYALNYGSRCVIALQPRGGRVTIGRVYADYTFDLNGTMGISGLLTASTGSTHLGIKLGSSYLNSLNKDIILQNNTALRFGTSDSWDYNVWAGLKYDSTNKIISLGLADGTIFSANSAQTGGTLQLVNLSTIRPNTNNTGSLGSSSFYFNSAYINNIYGTVSKASALTSNAGSSSNPIYFSNGVPTACGYTIKTSVPENAKFTDTTYTFSSENATLKWDTSTKIATVGGTEIYVSLPTNPNTNTEYSAGTGLSLLDTTFNLKTATTSAIGGMKASNALTSAVSLTSSNGATSSRYYGVQVDSNGLAFVNVPWVNTNTNTLNTVGATTSTNTLYLVGVTSNTGNSSLLSYINPNIYVSGTNLYVSSGLVSADTLYINNTSLLLGRVEIGGNIEADDSDNTYTIGTNSTRWHTLFCKNINCSTSAYLQKITSGTITPLSDKNYDLGTTSLYWRYVYCDNVYAKTDVIGAYTSDRRLKTDIHTDDYITKILNLGDVVEFKYNSLAQSLDKGDEKQHTGIIYQNALNAGIDGLCRMEEDGYGSVNPYSRNLIFTTIGALQLTIKELLSIKEKIAKLEEEIRVLKAQL